MYGLEAMMEQSLGDRWLLRLIMASQIILSSSVTLLHPGLAHSCLYVFIQTITYE